MVVVAIIAAMAGLVIPRIGNRNNKIKAEIRRLSTLSRQVRSFAKLKNSTYRIVIDMKNGPEGSEPAEYWVESSQQPVLIAQDRKKAYEERLQATKDETEHKQKSIPKDGFTADTSILKKASTLSSNMIFESVELIGYTEPVNQGKVYIHFFPSGKAEEAAIHLKLDDLRWTLGIHPLTGRTEIATKFLSLKDLRDQ